MMGFVRRHPRLTAGGAALAVVLIAAGVFYALNSHPNMPIKRLPAYTFGIDLPVRDGPVPVAQGGSLVVPVTVSSLADTPFDVLVTLDVHNPQLGDYLRVTDPDGYVVSLAPGARRSLQFVLAVDGNAPLGRCQLVVQGKLETPVPDRADLGAGFNIQITGP